MLGRCGGGEDWERGRVGVGGRRGGVVVEQSEGRGGGVEGEECGTGVRMRSVWGADGWVM